MGRDPQTGRFLPGNRIAVGNKGNRNPKYGNKNSIKHGLYGVIAPVIRLRNDFLYIAISRASIIRLYPDEFFCYEDGNIAIRDDIAEQLEKLGVSLSDTPVDC